MHKLGVITNTVKNIRSAINRHLNDIGRSVDIVRDKEFKSANQTLDEMLKKMTKIGASRPTKHKEVINPEDLFKISSYLVIYGQPSSLPWFFDNVFGNVCSPFISSLGVLNFTISCAAIPLTFTQMKTAQNTSLFDTKPSKRIFRVSSRPKRPLVTNGCIHHQKQILALLRILHLLIEKKMIKMHPICSISATRKL